MGDGFGEHGGGADPEAVFAVERLIDDERLERFRVARETEDAVIAAFVMAIAAGTRLGRKRRKRRTHAEKRDESQVGRGNQTVDAPVEKGARNKAMAGSSQAATFLPVHPVKQRWARRLVWFAWAGAVALSAAAVEEQESTKAATPEPAPTESSTAKGPRAVSPHLAAVLAEKMPKFEAKPEDKNATEQSGSTDAGALDDQPANGIVRLPSYIVRETRPPTAQDVRSAVGLESYAMNKYMGDAQGFSRGVLNHFRLERLWSSIPLIGKIPLFDKMEKRAIDMYYDDEARKALLGLASFDAGAQVTAKKGDARESKSGPVADKTTTGTTR